jgi:hypothetical protein
VPLDKLGDLPSTLAAAGLGAPGIGIVHARTDRVAGAALLRRLQREVDTALAGYSARS